jgi:hypothetical protein
MIFTPFLTLKKMYLIFPTFNLLKKKFFSFVNKKWLWKNTYKFDKNNTQFHSQTYCLFSFDINNCNPPLFYTNLEFKTILKYNKIRTEKFLMFLSSGKLFFLHRWEVPEMGLFQSKFFGFKWLKINVFFCISFIFLDIK